MAPATATVVLVAIGAFLTVLVYLLLERVL